MTEHTTQYPVDSIPKPRDPETATHPEELGVEELRARLAEKEKENTRLKAENETLRNENGELRRRLVTDELTGLLNEKGAKLALAGMFDDIKQGVLAPEPLAVPHTGRRIRGRHGDRGSEYDPRSDRMVVLYLDLDGFKGVNDRYGHDVGDEALQHAAAVLEGSVRNGDVVARLHGDELVVGLRASDRLVAESDIKDIVRQKLTGALEYARDWMVRERGVSPGAFEFGFSIGVCMVEPSSADSPQFDYDAITKVAETRMREDKESRKAAR